MGGYQLPRTVDHRVRLPRTSIALRLALWLGSSQPQIKAVRPSFVETIHADPAVLQAVPLVTGRGLDSFATGECPPVLRFAGVACDLSDSRGEGISTLWVTKPEKMGNVLVEGNYLT